MKLSPAKNEARTKPRAGSVNSTFLPSVTAAGASHSSSASLTSALPSGKGPLEFLPVVFLAGRQFLGHQVVPLCLAGPGRPRLGDAVIGAAFQIGVKQEDAHHRYIAFVARQLPDVFLLLGRALVPPLLNPLLRQAARRALHAIGRLIGARRTRRGSPEHEAETNGQKHLYERPHSSP